MDQRIEFIENSGANCQIWSNYVGGNYGYGHSKQALFEVLLKKYNPASERFDYCMNHLDEVDYALEIGAEKVKKVALQERL